MMAGEAAENASRRKVSTALRADRRIEAARGYLALEMPEHALGELDAVTLPGHFRFDWARLRGEALRHLGRFHQAAAAYTRALAERPDSLPTLMGIAVCYRHLGQIDRAIAAMEEANRLHPNEPAVLFALSRFYALVNDSTRALRWLSRAARVCPEVVAYAETDRDFAILQASPQFRNLVEAAEARERW